MSGWEIREGDSLSLIGALEPMSVDAVITDPPYSSGGQFKGDRSSSPIQKYQTGGFAQGKYPDFGGDTRDQRSMLTWCSWWLAESLRVTRPGGSLIVFSDWRMLPTMTDAIQIGGWTWRGIVPWVKPHARPQMGRFTAQCEYAIWATRGGMAAESKTAQPIKGVIGASSVPAASRLHVTEKPVDVMRHLVKICTPGGLVLDPFTGSGSTGEAALLEGRRFLGFEMSAEYAQIARDRLTGVTVAEAA